MSWKNDYAIRVYVVVSKVNLEIFKLFFKKFKEEHAYNNIIKVMVIQQHERLKQHLRMSVTNTVTQDCL